MQKINTNSNYRLKERSSPFRSTCQTHISQVMRLGKSKERKMKKNQKTPFFKKPSLAYKTHDSSHLTGSTKYKKNHEPNSQQTKYLRIKKNQPYKRI
jgi:hypothetical protein